MPQIINSNIASLTAQRNLNSSQSSLNTSLQRLSSGLRINSARDDAAGLAISERFSTQIRGLNQAARNANDGISLAQTAEGDLNQVTNNLQRIRELAVQSANATNSASDRAALQLEVSQLVEEIDRVASTSNFNGVNLLDGNFTNRDFQVGADAGQTVTIASIASSATADLGQAQTATYTGTAVTADLLAGDLTINGTDVGAVSGDAAAIATAIETAGGSTITATATNSQTAIAFTDVVGTVAVPAVATTLEVGNYTTAVSNARDIVANSTAVSGAFTDVVLEAGEEYSINLDTGGSVTNVILNAGGATVTGANVQSGFDQASIAAAGYTIGGSVAGGDLTITRADGQSFDIIVGNESGQATDPGANGFTANANFADSNRADEGTATTNTINNGQALVTDNNFTVQIDSIDLIDVVATEGDSVTGAELDTALASFLTANTGYSIASGSFATGNLVLNRNDGEDTSIVITSNFTAGTPGVAGAFSGGASVSATDGTAAVAVVNPSAAGAYSFNVDGNVLDFSTAGSDGTIDGNEIAGLINNITGFTSSFDGGSGNLTITKTDGSNFTLSEAGANGTDPEGITDAAETTYRGTIQVDASDGVLAIAGTDPTKAGLTTITPAATTTGTTVGNTDISTVAGANAAIASIDNALTTVNNSRASLGAIQNRFDSVVSSIQTTSENLSAARSRIRDADFAAETAALTRNQILQQAGVSILAQANALPQLALSLLQ